MEKFPVGKRQPLFFMHIPKTAGMSMRMYLKDQYHSEDVCTATRWQDILGHEETLATYRLVQGHFRYNLRSLLAKDVRTLVLLRDPMRRTISALRHLQRDPDFHQDHELSRKLTFGQVLRHPRLIGSQQNVQARFLCASNPAGEVSTQLLRAKEEGRIDADAGNGENPPDLELAKERLASFDFIGLTEDLNSVLSNMGRTMGYHPARQFPRINDDPGGGDALADLSQEELDLVRHQNDVDVALYDFARKLIARREVEQRLSDLVGSGIYQIPRGSFEIAVTDILPGSGWYPAERAADTAWRWTGPKRQFTIEVPLQPDASYRVKMNFSSVAQFGPGDLMAEVNDAQVECELAQADAGYLCELLIRRELLAASGGFCCIRFDTGGTVHASGGDNRRLGVAVRRLVFECLDS